MGTMPGWIRISLPTKSMVVGLHGADILIDEEERGFLRFGEETTLEVAPGKREVQAVLHGVLGIKRKSKTLTVAVEEGEQIVVLGPYSRFWGKVILRLA